MWNGGRRQFFQGKLDGSENVSSNDALVTSGKTVDTREESDAYMIARRLNVQATFTRFL